MANSAKNNLVFFLIVHDSAYALIHNEMNDWIMYPLGNKVGLYILSKHLDTISDAIQLKSMYHFLQQL